MRRVRAEPLRVLISLAAMVAAGVALFDSLREFRYREVEAYVAAIPPGDVALALALSFLSVLATSSLDLLALRQLGRAPPLGPALLASAVSTSVSNCASPALLTGGTLRLRLYSALGLSAEDVGNVVLFGAAGFWLGFLLLASGVFLTASQPLPPSLAVPRVSVRIMGGAFGLAVAVYLAGCLRGARTLQVRGWLLRLPTAGMAVSQVLVSALDWLLAAAALWILAPDFRSVPFPAFLTVYLAAQAIGLASHVPAGLGVFEAVVVRALAPHAHASDVLGALAAYRAVYYLAPLAASLVALGGAEVLRRLHLLEGVRKEVRR